MTDPITVIDLINTGGIVAILVLAVIFLVTGKLIPKILHDKILQIQSNEFKKQLELQKNQLDNQKEQINLQASQLKELTQAIEKLNERHETDLTLIVKTTVHTIMSEYKVGKHG